MLGLLNISPSDIYRAARVADAVDPTKGGWGRFSLCLLASTWACKFRNIGEIIPQLHVRHRPEQTLRWLQTYCRGSCLLALKQRIWFKPTFIAFVQTFLPKLRSFCISHSSACSCLPLPLPPSSFPQPWEQTSSLEKNALLIPPAVAWSRQKKLKSFEQRILVRTRNNTDLSEDGMYRQRGGSGCVCCNQLSARLQYSVEYMENNFPLHLHLIQWLWTTHYLKKMKSRHLAFTNGLLLL